MTRGKSDKVDALRISQCGEDKIIRLKSDKPLEAYIIKLKQLNSSVRSIKEKKQVSHIANQD